MIWTADERRGVGRAFLGCWPGTVTAWGKEAFAAYIGELEARGLPADRVLMAIRTWPAGTDFPPSAPNLAAAARKDPGAPTFEEALELIRACLACRVATVDLYPDRLRERERVNDELAMQRAVTLHPLVAPFMVRQGGPARLRAMGLWDAGNEYREARRRELRGCWRDFCLAVDGREAAVLASGRRRGELASFDPLAALGRPAAGLIEAASAHAAEPNQEGALWSL